MSSENSYLLAGICLIVLYVTAWCSGIIADLFNRSGLPRMLLVMVLVLAAVSTGTFGALLWSVAMPGAFVVGVAIFVLGLLAGFFRQEGF